MDERPLQGRTGAIVLPVGVGLADGPRKELPSLRALFWAHRGLLSDKWEQYIPIYES